MSTLFNLNRDISGIPAYSPKFSIDGKKVTLSANVAQNFTVPSNYSIWTAIFMFEPGATIYVANNHTAEVPTGSFTDTFSELNPQARMVEGGDVLSFITADTTASVIVKLYAVSL